VVVDGLLIKRVHFVGLGPSSGCPNVIGDFSGIFQTVRSKKYLCPRLGEGKGHCSAQ
jgi:hypothetical protein